MKRIGVVLGLLVVVFLLGLVPMWLKARGSASERDEAWRALRLSQMQNMLATGAIRARRGDYEPARQAASAFFTSLRTELDRGDESAFTEEQRDPMRRLHSQQDAVITLLARGDPAAAERLANLYVAYIDAVGGASEARS